MTPLSLRSVLATHDLSSLRALESVTHSADFLQNPDNSVRAQASRAVFIANHAQTGGEGGPLGIAMGDIRPSAAGFVKPYSGAIVTLSDPSDGPRQSSRHRVEVRFVGFRCHEQSEHPLIGSGDGDEPYFIISVTGTNADRNTSVLFKDYDHIKTENNHYVGRMVTIDAQPPITITVVGMEYDDGSPAEASAKVEKQLNAAAAKLTLSLAVFGVNPAVGSYVQSFINIFGGAIGDAAQSLFGMGDDTIGHNYVNLFDYDNSLMAWKSPPPLLSPVFDKPYNVELLLAGGDAGRDSRYSVYLQVDLFVATSEPA